MSDQGRIWDHFQSHGVSSFDGSLPRLSFLARRISKLKPGGRVLNVGVGGGLFERAASERGLKVCTLDPSHAGLAAVLRHAPVAGRSAVGVCERMPFAGQTFDAVVMSEVLEHLDEDTGNKALEQVVRVVRPGGHFVGTVPAREDLTANEAVCPHCGHLFHRWGHQRTFDAASLSAHLGRHFDSVEVEERHFSAPDRNRKTAWSRWKGRLRGGLTTLGVLSPPPSSMSLAFQARRR